MSFLNKEIKNPISLSLITKLGFKHIVLSLLFMLMTQAIIVSLIFSDFPLVSDIFGFYFSTFTQELTNIIVITTIGTSLSSWIIGRQIANQRLNPNLVLQKSLKWSVLFNLSYWLLLYLADQTPHYGVTPREELYTSIIPLSVISILIFAFITNIFFKKK